MEFVSIQLTIRRGRGLPKINRWDPPMQDPEGLVAGGVQQGVAPPHGPATIQPVGVTHGTPGINNQQGPETDAES